jgi:hypothetical protein
MLTKQRTVDKINFVYPIILQKGQLDKNNTMLNFADLQFV